MIRKLLIMALTTFAALPMYGQEGSSYSFIEQFLDKNSEEYSKVAREIWESPELGYLEVKSSQILIALLKKNGFEVEEGVADMPTSFIATFTTGKGPTIGYLAEYDALPGLSQDAVPYPKPLITGGNGHGCGHHLFGTASIAAAISLKEWLKANNQNATIKVFGTPAEEGGAGKAYMVRAKHFEEVDAVINWHPSDRNAANATTCTAVMQGVFRFYGQTAHAAMAPERGKSALDGVEAMNMMVNMMREHVDQESRIHYVITNGGLAANVVPDFAEVEYMVRHPDVTEVIEIWERVKLAAEGAALGTGTKMEVEVIAGIYGLLPNETLAKTMHKNLSTLGGITYTPEEEDFARKIQETYMSPKTPPLASVGEVQPYKLTHFPASTDVGDVSYVVPTVGLGTATWVPGTGAHTWQATAAGGMSIGYKGMMLAAKTMAFTGMDLVKDPMLIDAAKKEFKERLGGLVYKPLIGDRMPPLDYRIR